MNSLDTVYPGVTVNGTDVSGMTYDEVLSAYENTDISVTVTMPNSDSFTLSAADIGLSVTGEDIADTALSQGREGNIISKVMAYITASSNPVEVMDFFVIDAEAVKSAVTPYVEAYNTAVSGDPYEIKDGKLIILKGAGQLGADMDEVTALVTDAFEVSFTTCAPESTEYVLSDIKEVSIQDIYDSVYIAPENAAYDSETDSIIPSVTGVSFDIDSAKTEYDSAEPGDTITVDLVYTEPEIVAQTNEDLLYRDVLHTVSTTLATSSYNRKNNIKLAAAAINGYILEPGDVFSFNGVVGERTSAKGYLPAGAYAGGKSVDQVGGGICQVSSSLYCCAVYSDLEIVSRTNHMFTVSYLPLGIDATVNWGTLDFKFANNTEFPIMIEAYVQGSNLVVTFHGTKLDDTYAKITYEIGAVYNFETIEEVDESLAPGETKVDTAGHTGYLVHTYRSWYTGDGELIETEYLAKSTYSKSDKIILVGPEPEPTPEPPENPTGGSETPAA